MHTTIQRIKGGAGTTLPCVQSATEMVYLTFLFIAAASALTTVAANGNFVMFDYQGQFLNLVNAQSGNLITLTAPAQDLR